MMLSSHATPRTGNKFDFYYSLYRYYPLHAMFVFTSSQCILFPQSNHRVFLRKCLCLLDQWPRGPPAFRCAENNRRFMRRQMNIHRLLYTSKFKTQNYMKHIQPWEPLSSRDCLLSLKVACTSSVARVYARPIQIALPLQLPCKQPATMPFLLDKTSQVPLSKLECTANVESHAENSRPEHTALDSHLLQTGHRCPTAKVNQVAYMEILPSIQPDTYQRLQWRTSAVRPWIYIAFISIVCVLASCKAPLGSYLWRDGSNHYSYASYMLVYDDNNPTSPAMTVRPPFENNGRTDQVQWDKYSLVLRGQRIFLQ
jgi:hypothetical protein